MATATQSVHRKELDPHNRSSTSRHFEGELRQRVVGQNEAVQALVDLYQGFCAGLHSPGRPVGNLLFLGPTGLGKTRTVEAAAEILFGDKTRTHYRFRELLGEDAHYDKLEDVLKQYRQQFNVAAPSKRSDKTSGVDLGA